MPDGNMDAARMPAPQTRRWIGLAAAAFLLMQLLLPLRYYLNTPTTDERFAWRMFSSLSQHDCVAKLYQVIEADGRRYEEQVPAMVLAPWQNLLDANRPDVVEKMMRACCQRPGVIGVRYKLTCKAVDGAELPPQQLWMDRQTLRVRTLETRNP